MRRFPIKTLGNDDYNRTRGFARILRLRTLHRTRGFASILRFFISPSRTKAQYF